MAMLRGVTKWLQELAPEWRELVEQGVVIHTGASREEGRGGLAAGDAGLAWAICGTLGRLVSSGQVSWKDLSDFQLDDETQSLSFGYQGSAKDRVTFKADVDNLPPGLHSAVYERPGARHRFQRLARARLHWSGWPTEDHETGWSRTKAAQRAAEAGVEFEP